MSDKFVLQKANAILRVFAPHLFFVWHKDKLCLLYNRPEFKQRTVQVQVAKHSGALCINYGRLGMGGTMAMAVGQLARWIRGQTRVPLAAWRSW